MPAHAASARAAAPSCPGGSVCLWSGEGFGGRTDGVGPSGC
ncbi:peptidase inhibitor family I36 protein [Streptomyces sp. NPDC048521]